MIAEIPITSAASSNSEGSILVPVFSFSSSLNSFYFDLYIIYSKALDLASSNNSTNLTFSPDLDLILLPSLSKTKPNQACSG